jgi:hypothetical protein
MRMDTYSHILYTAWLSRLIKYQIVLTFKGTLHARMRRLPGLQDPPLRRAFINCICVYTYMRILYKSYLYYSISAVLQRRFASASLN